jgi:hypothetical protein
VRRGGEKIDAVVPDGIGDLPPGAYQFADQPVPADDLDLLRVQVRLAGRA